MEEEDDAFDPYNIYESQRQQQSRATLWWLPVTCMLLPPFTLGISLYLGCRSMFECNRHWPILSDLTSGPPASITLSLGLVTSGLFITAQNLIVHSLCRSRVAVTSSQSDSEEYALVPPSQSYAIRVEPPTKKRKASTRTVLRKILEWAFYITSLGIAPSLGLLSVSPLDKMDSLHTMASIVYFITGDLSVLFGTILVAHTNPFDLEKRRHQRISRFRFFVLALLYTASGLFLLFHTRTIWFELFSIPQATYAIVEASTIVAQLLWVGSFYLELRHVHVSFNVPSIDSSSRTA